MILYDHILISFLKHSVSRDYYILQKYLPFVLFRLITIVNYIIELCKDVTNLIFENGRLQILQHLLILYFNIIKKHWTHLLNKHALILKGGCKYDALFIYVTKEKNEQCNDFTFQHKVNTELRTKFDTYKHINPRLYIKARC